MKKWLVSLGVVIVLALICFYFFIPSKIVITSQVTVQCTEGGTKRFLFNNNLWNKWWPGEYNDSSFSYKKNIYSFKAGYFNSAAVVIKQDEKYMTSVMNILPAKKDEVVISWNCELGDYKNPLARIVHYLNANQTHQQMTDILSHLKNFLEKPENIYGYKIDQTIVADTFLISTEKTLPHYPETADVYALIGDLKNYVKEQSAIETHPPMLHVVHEDSTSYLVKVALPVNKQLNGNKTFTFKEMIKGNILVTEVKGGPYNISTAMDALKTYVQDYSKTSPAIPFESMVTDRSQVSDTTKWVTKIYYPVM